jgi:hypothetical protein
MEHHKVADPILAPVNHDPWDPSTWAIPHGSSAPVHLIAGLGNALMQTWKGNVQGMVNPVVNLATLPGDVYTGKQSLATPEGQRRVQEAGLAMTGGGNAPEGAMASGLPWKQVLDHYKGLDPNGAFSAKAQNIGEYMQGGKLSPSEAVEQAGKALASDKFYYQTAAKIMEDHPLAPEKVQKAFIGHPLDHPALSKLPDSQQPMGEDLLFMMKDFPGEYQSPNDALKHMKDNNFLNKDELSDYEIAAKKLQEYQDFHGKFNFVKNPLMEPAPKAAPPGWTSADPLAGLTHPLDRGLSPIKSPEEALYPINWSDLSSTVKRPGETATGPYADTLRRAESLGYNTNLPLFKGLEGWEMPTAKSPGEGIWGPEAEKVNAWSDPSTKPGERGIFASDTPEVSNSYASGSNAQTFQMFANPKSTLAVHWPDVAGQPSYSGNVMQRLIEAARAKGAEALVIHGMHDLGGAQTQYVFMRPNILRSTFAMFDPAKKESANLLHSGGSPLLVPVNHDPFGAQNEQ